MFYLFDMLETNTISYEFLLKKIEIQCISISILYLSLKTFHFDMNQLMLYCNRMIVLAEFPAMRWNVSNIFRVLLLILPR